MPTDANHLKSVAKLRAAEIEAADRFVEAVNQARAEGVSWRELSEATGLSVSRIRWRATNGGEGWDYIKERREGAVETAAKREADKIAAINASQTVQPGTEPLPVTKATEQLGVSRPTAYTWLWDGRIAWTKVESGRVVVERDNEGRIVVGRPGDHKPLPRAKK